MGTPRGGRRLTAAGLVALGLGCAAAEPAAPRPTPAPPAGDVDPLAAAWTLPPPVVIRPPAPEPLRCPRLEVRPSLGRTPARRVDVAAEDEPLASVVARLARDAGLTLAVDPALDEKVTLSLRDIPPREVFDILAWFVHARVVDLPGGGALLVPTEAVTASFADHEVHAALETIGRLAGVTVVVADDLRGRATVDLHEAPWREAVDLVARAVGAEVAHERGCTLVGRPPAAPLTRRHALSPETVWALHEGVRVDLVAEGADAQEVAEALGRLAWCHVLVDPAVKSRVHLTLTDAPFGVAVDLLARALGCDVVRRRPDGSVLLLTPGPGDRVRAQGAPAAVLFQALAADAGQQVVVGPGVDGLVSVDLRGLHPEEALRVVAWKHGWQVEERPGDALVITTPSPRPGKPLPMTPFEAEVDKLVEDIARLARERRVDDLATHAHALRDLVAARAAAPPGFRTEPVPEAPDARSDLLVRLLLAELDDADPTVWSGSLRQVQVVGRSPAAVVLRDLLARVARRLDPPTEDAPVEVLLAGAADLVDGQRAALEAGDAAAARAAWRSAEHLLRGAYVGTDDEALLRQVEMVFRRGYRLELEAQALAELQHRFGPLLRVTAVLSRGTEREALAVMGGRLQRELDGIVDPATDELIDGLTVLEVTADGVRLRFEGYAFTCPLGGGPPRR